MTKFNFAHSIVRSIEATKHCISILSDLFDVIFSLCCVRYSNYCVPWSFLSNTFLFVSSFPGEILEKPVLPIVNYFASYFASLILPNQQLSTRFLKENRFRLPNVVCYMVKVTELCCTRVVS